MLEEEIRISFLKWLYAADATQSNKSLKNSVLIVIDGIDQFLDPSGRDEIPDWLPTKIPFTTKVIFTCNKNSRSYQHFYSKVENIIELSGLPAQCVEAEFTHICGSTPEVAKHECFRNPLYLKMYLSFCYHADHPLKFPRFSSVESIESLFNFAVDYYSGTLGPEVASVLTFIAVSHSGLSVKQLLKLTGDCPYVEATLSIFACCLFEFQESYMLRTQTFTQMIKKKFAKNIEAATAELTQRPEKEELSAKALDERLYIAQETKNHLLVKDYLVDLHNFNLLMTPGNQLRLCHYWVRLVYENFDPAHEYNRSLENFVAQYSPSNPDLFVALTQLCRFFKLFGILEPSKLCPFKHPHLKGKYELQDIGLLIEVEGLEGMFANRQLYPLTEEELFSVEDLPAQENNKLKPAGYFYRRWLWIQFPWCTLDVYSNLSLALDKLTADTLSASNDYDLYYAFKKLFQPKGPQTKEKALGNRRALILKPQKINRERHKSALAKQLPIIRPNHPSFSDLMESSHASSLSSIHYSRSSKFLSLNKFDKKPESIEHWGKLQPGTALLAHSSKVTKLAMNNIKQMTKENYKLQTVYNKLVNQGRLKKIQLEGLTSQLTKGEEKMQEKNQIAEKITDLQHKMEQVFNKVNKAEVECRRLTQVLNCCFKNPAKNDEWTRKLEKGIDSLKCFIKKQSSGASMLYKESKAIEEDSKKLVKWTHEKSVVQSATIDRVNEQIKLEDSMLNLLEEGERRRIEIIEKYSQPDREKFYKDKLKEKQQQEEKIRSAKLKLKDRVKSYETSYNKITNAMTNQENKNISSLIWQFQKNEELSLSIKTGEKKLQVLKSQKESLKARLQFLKSKETASPTKQVFETMDNLNVMLLEAEKRLAFFANNSQKLEFRYVDCVESLRNIWVSLKINEPFEFRDRSQHYYIMNIVSRLKNLEERVGNDLIMDIAMKDYEDIKKFVSSKNAIMAELDRSV